MTPRDIGFHDGLDGLPPACNASHREDRRSETNNIFAVEYLAGYFAGQIAGQKKVNDNPITSGDYIGYSIAADGRLFFAFTANRKENLS